MIFTAVVIYCAFCFYLALPRSPKTVIVTPSKWARVERINETRCIR